MNEGNYYQGAGLNISEAVHAELRAGQVNYDGSAVERAVASGAQAQQGLVDEVQRLQDYQEGAEAMRKLRELRGRQEGKLRERLAAAPGTKLSLLRENGEVDEEKFEAFMQTASDEVAAVRPRFWSPQRLVRYEQEYADFAEETERHVKGLVAGHMTAGVRRAGKAALEEAEKLGDVLGYQRELRNQVDAGVLTETEARVKMMEFNERSYAKVQEGYMMQVRDAWYKGGEHFAKLYDDPEFRDGLSPENQLKLEQLAARMPVDVPQQRVREVKGRDGSTRLEAEPREAPRGMPRGLVGVWNKYNGDFDSIEAKEEARKPLLTYLRGLVQHADDPAELEQAKAVCKVYGYSAEFASQVVGQLRKEIDGTAEFNAREAVKVFRGQGLYFRPENTMMVEEMRTRFAELAGKERSDAENKEYKVLSEKIAKWEGYDKAETERAERAIFAKFDQWILRNPKANYMQQARAFYDFCDAHSQEDSLALDVDKMAEEAAGMFERDLLAEREKRKQAGIDLRADIKVAERMRADAEAARDKAAAEEADAEAGESMVEVSLVSEVGATNGWAGNATERILYVPKGHALAGKDVLLQTPADVEADKVKVVEHANCSAPMMSQKLRRDMGLLKNPYDTITFEGSQGRLSQGGFMATAKRARSLGGLAPYYRAFVDAARRNDLDPNLLMAIAMHETGRGTSRAFRNKKNAMGVSDSRGPVAFRSVEQSIYYMAEQLRRNYVGKGLTTIEEIGKKYAPIGAGNDPKGLNKHWATGVARYMDELTK